MVAALRLVPLSCHANHSHTLTLHVFVHTHTHTHTHTRTDTHRHSHTRTHRVQKLTEDLGLETDEEVNVNLDDFLTVRTFSFFFGWGGVVGSDLGLQWLVSATPPPLFPRFHCLLCFFSASTGVQTMNEYCEPAPKRQKR